MSILTTAARDNRGGASRHVLAFVTVGLITTSGPTISPAQTVDPAGMRLADATRIANEAVRLATDGPPIAVVIVNAEGRTVTAQRMDGTSFINMEAAEQKARTAVALAEPTKQSQQELAHGELSLLAIPGMLPMAGGLPLLSKGRVVGAIGVSGREPVDDDLLAVKARRVFSGGADTTR